jgi:hypothetical protein
MIGQPLLNLWHAKDLNTLNWDLVSFAGGVDWCVKLP